MNSPSPREESIVTVALALASTGQGLNSVDEKAGAARGVLSTKALPFEGGDGGVGGEGGAGEGVGECSPHQVAGAPQLDRDTDASLF